jgi:hypothetical protein
MSEPSELSPDARSLVEQGRLGDAPSANDKQRLKSRLAAELGAGAFAVAALSSTLPSATYSASTLTASSTAARGLWRQGVVKVVGAVSALGALAALYVGAISWTPTKAPAHAYAPVVVPPPEPPASEERAMPAEIAATSDTTLAEPELVAPAAVSQPPSTRAKAASSPSNASRGARARVDGKRSAPSASTLAAGGQPPASTLGEEAALLATAQRALGEHQPGQALQVAQQHARRFASGSLGEERRGIEALAHCQLGEAEHPSVAAFLEEAPSSPLAARVRRECAAR